jgi:hypothetical protein
VTAPHRFWAAWASDPKGDATIYRASFGGGGRYQFDSKLLREGYRQYDTDQDAWYFGVWYHSAARIVVTFAEGDATVVECATPEAWSAEVAAMAAFYGDPPPAFVVFDANGRTDVYDPTARPEAA